MDIRINGLAPGNPARAKITVALAATQQFFNRHGFGPREGNGDVQVQVVGSHGSSYNSMTDTINLAARHLDDPFGLTQTLAHEYTHRIDRHVVGFPGLVSDGQSGSVGEAISDAVAAAVLVSSGVASPELALQGLDPVGKTADMGMHGKALPLPTHIDGYRRLWLYDNGGVHFNEGIPRQAATVMARSIGLEKTAGLHVDAMRQLGRVADFRELAQAVTQMSERRFGAGGPETQVTSAAWSGVGIAPARPAVASKH